MAQPVIASFKQDGLVPDGDEYRGDFKAIYVGGTSGDIAISRDGVNYTIYPSVPTDGYILAVKASIIGSAANGTVATGLVWGTW